MIRISHFNLRVFVALLLGSSLVQASKYSVQPNATLTLEGWSLFDGGIDTGESSLALLHLGTDFSFGDNTRAHVGGFLFSGDNDVDAFTGDFGVYSNAITDSRYVLFTAWLQSEFQNSTFRWGQLAVDETFFVSETGSLFINGNFGAIPTVSANVAAPIFSVGAAGAEYRFNGSNGYTQLGIYAGDSGPADEDDHGFNWRAGGDAGYFFILERGFEYQLSPDSAGTAKIGGYYHTGRFESFASSKASSGLASYYLVVDQAISKTANGFVRLGFNPDSERSAVSRYLDIGSSWKLFPDSRPEDLIGIAYSYTRFSNVYAELEGLVSNSRSEQVFEFTYSTEIVDGWNLQPSLQWIIDPVNAAEDVFVGGLRLFREF